MLKYRHRGGGCIYEIICMGIFTIIIYKVLDKYLIEQKGKIIIGKINLDNNLNITRMPTCIKKYLSNIHKKLFNISNPYGLSLKKYILIKYVFSFMFFIVSIINKNSILVSLIITIFTHFIPNLLIYMFKKNERVYVIKNLRNIVNSMVISLSASLTLESALKSSIDAIEYKRLKEEFETFIDKYKTYGYNMRKAINSLKEKFNYYEIELFISTLLNAENDGNIIKSLEKYNMVLDISYSKYLAKENSKRVLYLTLGTVLALVNIIIIVMYPMFIEVAENLQVIFS